MSGLTALRAKKSMGLYICPEDPDGLNSLYYTIEVNDAQGVAFLRRLLTIDVKNIHRGEVRQSFILNALGLITDFVWVAHLPDSDEHFRVVFQSLDTLAWMQRWAVALNAAIAGSLPVLVDGGYRNRFFFVTPHRVEIYDKRHLFGYGGEDKVYVPGCERVVVSFRGWRLLLQVCYDLRFPVFARNRGDYDAMLYVANWPASRIEVWDVLLRARALENQCYVLAANRVGSDPVASYSGHSRAVDAYGRIMAGCEDGREGFLSAVFDMEKLIAFRRKFPVLSDGDDFRMD